ncbi:sulfite exporter TauE/SafE family protein [Brevibacillus humidisoli]|uniref:sulfite exporter TauE/SafE family protein n=1 Tax=Brevibacillus humidisoli TaxID=2895522 RepID=UPI001E4376D6|nr:sulfite exporter TauE/SafE family protein [Brevibacillus humidisoli]UFJ43160.1 sulfite exporter TauE/SafE family protein [Brevibacillus humidisoli]
MEFHFLSILSLGFWLGIKHAIEPDHVIAVSTIASRSRNLWRSSLAGVYWGIGHTATLFVVGLIFILMKSRIPEVWAMSLEFTVGIMLVWLGLSNALYLHRRQKHTSYTGVISPHGLLLNTALPPDDELPYMKSAGIGLIHGLAGSAALVLLTMELVPTVWMGAMYILCFGAGTVLGMLLFTTVLGIPFVLSVNRVRLNTVLTRLTGVVSVVFGVYYMYNLGVTEGLFRLWIQ